MVLPRAALIAILGGVLLLAAFFGTRGLPAGSDDGGAPTAAKQPASAPQAGSKVKSGKLRVVLSASDLEGAPELRGGFRAELAGRFQSRGATEPPAFDFALDLEGAGERIELGAVSAGDSGFVRFDGKTYVLPEELWAQFRTQIAASAGESAGLDLNPGAWLVNERRAGGERIDGVETVHTTGSVDVGRVLGDIAKLAPGAELPAGAREQVEKAVERADVDLYEGKDGIVRRFRLRLDLAVPPELREQTQGLERGRIELSFDLSDVNKPQRIAAPSSAKPLDASALAELPFAPAIDGQVAPASPAARPATGAKAGPGLPPKVARAISDGKVVVLLFTQPSGDDDATEDSLRAVRRIGGVAVFTDSVEDLADYGRVVSGLGISQTPAIVIVRRDGTADLLEGYTDSGSLVQQVEDARR